MGKIVIPGRPPSDDEWQALTLRHAAPVLYAVRTTGIYCRAGCPARTPNRKNVSLFDTRASAEAAGFRACKRCWTV